MNITMDEEALAQVKTYLSRAGEEMEEGYQKLNELMEKIYSEERWLGQSQKAFMIYLSLMNQYHRCFTDINEDNPLAYAVKAFSDMENENANFYEECSEYRWLLEIE